VALDRWGGKWNHISIERWFRLTHSLTTECTKNYCNWAPIIQLIVEHTSRFLPARRYASAGNSDRNVSVRLSVCLSVRPSGTRQYCVKTNKASGMISSPSGSPKTLVFRCQISSPNSKGFPRTGASKKGRSEKFGDFLALSVNISKTVADTAKVTISD